MIKSNSSKQKDETTGGAKTDLTALLNLPTREQKNAWNVVQARRLVEAVVENAKKEKPSKMSVLIKAIGVPRSEATCKSMLVELRQAAREGMSLEDYFLKKRPFRPGNKIMAKKPKA